ncbi:hypothetical protein M9458_034155, partial [Cirrhinus mrigala]
SAAGAVLSAMVLRAAVHSLPEPNDVSLHPLHHPAVLHPRHGPSHHQRRAKTPL